MTGTYENAARIEEFNKDISILSKHLVLDHLGESHRIKPDKLTLDKSSWIASLLSASPTEEHQKLAIDFGILAYHFAETNDDYQEEVYRNLLYVIAARAGSIPTLTAFEEDLDKIEAEVISGTDSILGTEVFTERNVYLTEDGRTLSKFQNDIWNSFEDDVDIAISGPTSSGKSHIVKDFLEASLDESPDFEAIYLVPTRALIAENSSRLRSIIKDVNREEDVKVVTGGAEEETNKSIIYVLTPERCLNLLENSEYEPDIIFVDEIQNIGDEERGVLYEIINNKLSSKWKDVRMIAAGPFLDNGKELLDEATGRDSTPIETDVSPVLQLRVGLTYTKENNLEITVFTPSNDKVTFEADFVDHRTWSQAKNMKKTLPTIVEPFSRGNKSLVYCHKSNLAEEWAQELAANTGEVEISGDAEMVIRHLKKRIHPDYPLIECLKSGVAFHHGKVPEIARTAVENMYEEDDFLETVVSTPTLLQGVNLPCQEIFILKPNKGNKNLGDFDFQNLVGRVGRLSENLSGVVYGVEREGHEWIDEQMEETSSQQITSATDKACDEKKEELLEKVGDANLKVDESPSVRYTIVLLRHKYLRADGSLEQYLEGKEEFSNDETEQIKSDLSEILDLEVPNNIVFKNPSVDPVKQDRLFKQVVESEGSRNSFDFWTFNPSWINESGFKGRCRQLNAIFEFCVDDYEDVEFDNYRDTETHLNYIGYIAEYAYLWMNGESYREIINHRIKRAPEREQGTTSIRKAIKTINDDTRFVLVKYFKILVDILEHLIEDGEVDEDDVPQHLLDIDTILERGSCDYTEINAMNAGLSRDMASSLDIPEEEDPIEYIEANMGELDEIERITLRNKNIL